ncbi:hypothetical protein AUP68_16301 [Ilyonectria robusta]
MSFTHAPVTRLAVMGLVAGSILASILDVKHYFYILIDTHIWHYRQFWRLMTYQLCYANSSEVLFAAMTIYNLRIIERILPPLVMVVLRPLTAGWFNYMPAGPTPIIFAMLAQYHAMVPHMYKYRVATSEAPPTNEPFVGLTFSDKSYKYAIAVHLALLQWPGSLLGAVIGWVVGYSWREGLLPAALVRWRVPGWVVGLSAQRRSAEFEGLRRRLEGESSAVTTGAQGAQGAGDGQAERRRTMGQQIYDQMREVL